MRNKTLFGAVLGIVLFASFAFAGFGDFITSSNSVVNPENMLTSAGVSDYALYQYTSNGVCPPGDFTSGMGRCFHSGSEAVIRPWAIIGFNDTNGSSIAVSAANYDDGCSGFSCGMDASVDVFVTEVYLSNSTNWTYLGTMDVPYNVSMNGSFNYSGTVDAVLIGSHGRINTPYPRVYWAQVI